MKELFKTLEFKGIERNTIGKYAHPIEMEKGKYDWGGSAMPMLMRKEATIKKLKQLYCGLDFDRVKLVSKELIDVQVKNFEYNDDDGLEYTLLREIDGSDEYNTFRQHYTNEIRSFLIDNDGRFSMTHQITLNIITDVAEMIKQQGYNIVKKKIHESNKVKS